MRIGIRVDSSQHMGTGHLRRSLSLARALARRGAQILFVTRNLGIDSEALIAAEGFADIETLPAPAAELADDLATSHAKWAQVDPLRDAEETIAALHDFAPDWVIVDSYSFASDWHEAVRLGLACRIAQIDDVADRQLAPDLLIDHNLAASHAAKYAGSLIRNARILGGPRYALLGPRFAEADRYAFHDSVRSVGIFMGGVDAGGFSAIALAALRHAGFQGPVEIVTTSANAALPELLAAAEQDGRARVTVDLPDLAQFFAAHDLQIGAGGGASWERCCIGVPTLLVIVAANQESGARALEAENVVALADEPSLASLGAALRKLLPDAEHRRKLAEDSRQLVDGCGARRVALAMLAESLAVRPARQEDARQTFDWRNDPGIRAVSREKDALDWDKHLAWFESVCADPLRQLFIGEIGGEPVGVIRFDQSEGERGEVSLYLDPSLHGLALGPSLLLAGEAASGLRTIDATVLEGNRPSQALFERCGYARTAATKWIKQRG